MRGRWERGWEVEGRMGEGMEGGWERREGKRGGWEGGCDGYEWGYVRWMGGVMRSGWEVDGSGRRVGWEGDGRWM